MINIYTLDAKSFKIEDSVHPRLFQVKMKGGIIILRNINTGNLLVLDNLANIRVDGNPVSIGVLERLVYNYSCSCESYGGSEPDYKIFDYTFDNTFE